MTVQDQVRLATGGWLNHIGRRVWSWGIHPDAITLLGAALAAFAASFIVMGAMQIAGVILLLSLPLDALDGAVARAMNQPNRKFGGVLDSTLDRYVDGLIFGALMLYFNSNGHLLLAAAALFALVGSFTTSYVRSRAGLAGVEVKVGLVDRLVRVIILLVGLFLPTLLPFVVVLLAITCNITTIQRLLYARKHLD